MPAERSSDWRKCIFWGAVSSRVCAEHAEWQRGWKPKWRTEMAGRAPAEDLVHLARSTERVEFSRALSCISARRECSFGVIVSSLLIGPIFLFLPCSAGNPDNLPRSPTPGHPPTLRLSPHFSQERPLPFVLSWLLSPANFVFVDSVSEHRNVSERRNKESTRPFFSSERLFGRRCRSKDKRRCALLWRSGGGGFSALPECQAVWWHRARRTALGELRLLTGF